MSEYGFILDGALKDNEKWNLFNKLYFESIFFIPGFLMYLAGYFLVISWVLFIIKQIIIDAMDERDSRN